MSTIRELVSYYLEEFPDEQASLSQLGNLLNNTAEDSKLKARNNFVGHITASSFIVNPSTRKVILILHKQLGIPLQPGGHVEAADATPLATAMREAKEEIGLVDLTPVPYHYNSEVPIDIDSHHIPANDARGEPEHYHHDFRFLFFTDATEDAVLLQEGEAQAFKWYDIRELGRFKTFDKIVDKIVKVLAQELRQRHFYDKVCQALPVNQPAGALVVTHILPDVLEYLSAIKHLADVVIVIPKPKSIVPDILRKVQTRFETVQITRTDLLDIDSITPLIQRAGGRVVVFDIGGWFAPVINRLAEAHPGCILGVVEDTENGHQKYEAVHSLAVPVVSVARSPLKDNEDFLVGQSVVFSADAILRECGYLIQYLNCSVLGYGKIGRSIAHHLLLRSIRPNVFDTDPLRRIAAYNHLCNIPRRATIFGSSDVIFSATGSRAADIIDFRSLKDGCFIFSVTSSDDEFNLAHVEAEYKRLQVSPYVERYSSFGNYFHLVNSGDAVNFIHKAVVGDSIHLVRAEMLVAYKLLAERHYQPGIHAVAEDRRGLVASSWLSTMCET